MALGGKPRNFTLYTTLTVGSMGTNKLHDAGIILDRSGKWGLPETQAKSTWCSEAAWTPNYHVAMDHLLSILLKRRRTLGWSSCQVLIVCTRVSRQPRKPTCGLLYWGGFVLQEPELRTFTTKLQWDPFERPCSGSDFIPQDLYSAFTGHANGWATGWKVTISATTWNKPFLSEKRWVPNWLNEHL